MDVSKVDSLKYESNLSRSLDASIICTNEQRKYSMIKIEKLRSA